ncbi:MAG: DUF881 domain-containing protein [Coriobacteriia bacterium]
MTGPGDKSTGAPLEFLVRSEKAIERVVGAQVIRARLVMSLALLLFLVGFLLVAQWRGADTLDSRLAAQEDQELAAVVQQLSQENDALRREVLRLEERIEEAEATEASQRSVLNEAARELQSLRVVSGAEAATGPGVTVRVSDPGGVLLASDLVLLVNEAKAAGAEAMSLGGARLTATTGIAQTDDGIAVDGKVLSGSVVLACIGDPDLIRQGLEMPGGVVSSLAGYPGVTVQVLEQESLTLPAATLEPMVWGEPVVEEETEG